MVALRNEQDDLVGRAVQLLKDAEGILLNPETSADDAAKAKRMMDEAKDMKGRADTLSEIKTLAGTLVNEPQASKGNQPSSFKDFTDFVDAMGRDLRSGGRDRDPRLEIFKETGTQNRGIKDMTGATGAAGGYLIPIRQSSVLMETAAPAAVVRPRANVIPMSARTLQIPMGKQTVGTAGVPTYFNGLRVYWQAEATQITASDANFEQAELVAHELVGYAQVGNSLIDDAAQTTSLAAYLSATFPAAVAWAEDYAFLMGDGVGKPRGIVSAPCTKVVTRNTTVTVKFEDVVGMVTAFMGNNPVWVINNSLKSVLLTMAGPSGFPVYLWGNATTGIPATLLGYPVIWTDKQPAVGTQGDIMLADFSKYVIGDRQADSVVSDRSARFQYNETVFRIVHRVDGQPWLPSAITLAGDASTVSPFVALSTL